MTADVMRECIGVAVDLVDFDDLGTLLVAPGPLLRIPGERERDSGMKPNSLGRSRNCVHTSPD